MCGPFLKNKYKNKPSRPISWTFWSRGPCSQCFSEGSRRRERNRPVWTAALIEISLSEAPSSLLTLSLVPCPLPAMPPQIIQFPEDQKVRAGESVELFGKVAGTQPITCTWMKFRKQVSEGGEWPKNDVPSPCAQKGPETPSCGQQHFDQRGLGNGRAPPPPVPTHHI